jgi:ribosomal protein S18 acetylase RimI-like enzyme
MPFVNLRAIEERNVREAFNTELTYLNLVNLVELGHHYISVTNPEFKAIPDANQLLVQHDPPRPELFIREYERYCGVRGLKFVCMKIFTEEEGPVDRELKKRGYLLQQLIPMVLEGSFKRSTKLRLKFKDPLDKTVWKTFVKYNRRFSMGWGKEYANVASLWKERLLEAGFDYYVTYRGESPVGMIGRLKVDGYGRVKDIVTFDNHRGKGIATAMCLEMVKRLRTEGCDRIYVFVESGNTAYTMFTNFGFKPLRPCRRYLKHVL